MKLDNFNITEAQALDSTNPPESTGGSGPTASASGAIPTSSDLSDGDPGNVQGSTSKKSNAGAIAGGVIGGVVGLILIAGTAWWFLKRNQRKVSQPLHRTNSTQIKVIGMINSNKLCLVVHHQTSRSMLRNLCRVNSHWRRNFT